MTEKKKRGRPKKTTESFPEGWKEHLIGLYAEGGCDVEARAYLGGIAIETFTRMMSDDEDFLDTIKKGRCLAEAWWRKMGR